MSAPSPPQRRPCMPRAETAHGSRVQEDPPPPYRLLHTPLRPSLAPLSPLARSLNFMRQEIVVGCSDAVLNTLLSICIVYIGWSRQRSWLRGSGAIVGGLRDTYRV